MTSRQGSKSCAALATPPPPRIQPLLSWQALSRRADQRQRGARRPGRRQYGNPAVAAAAVNVDRIMLDEVLPEAIPQPTPEPIPEPIPPQPVPEPVPEPFPRPIPRPGQWTVPEGGGIPGAVVGILSVSA